MRALPVRTMVMVNVALVRPLFVMRMRALTHFFPALSIQFLGLERWPRHAAAGSKDISAEDSETSGSPAPACASQETAGTKHPCRGSFASGIASCHSASLHFSHTCT
jgi:hypothetical protein